MCYRTQVSHKTKKMKEVPVSNSKECIEISEIVT